jgi:hypothetical protein
MGDWGLTLDISFRYGVVGWYKDRDKQVLRIYPLPFIRFSVEWNEGVGQA